MKNLSTSAGHGAEQLVAGRLSELGYTILAMNWRRRRCEVDVIAQKRDVVYFVEVKYRRGSSQGDGLDYITPAKIKQMQFGARLWVAENNWPGDYRLAAASVKNSANGMSLKKFIEL